MHANSQRAPEQIVKPATWRALLLWLCASTMIFGLIEFGSVTGVGGATPWYGLWGANPGVSTEPFQVAIANLDPSGPTARAGLRIGDRIDIRANSALERFELFGQPLSGRPIALSVRRGSARTRVSVVPGPVDLRQQRWAIIYLLPRLGNLWLVLFAALIVRRKDNTPQNLLLSTILISISIGYVMTAGNIAAPWTWAYVVSGICYQALLGSIALWAAFAGTFTAPLSRSRLIAQWICYTLVAAVIGVDFAQIIGLLTLWFDPVALMAPALNLTIASLFMAIVCSVLAIAASCGVERQRAVWSLVPLACLSCGLQIQVYLPKTSVSYATAIFSLGAIAVVVLITPVVLTYVALSRRLFDIGFVLNRAAVFAIISSIVVGVFVLVEWAASEWLVNASHSTSAIIGAAVALALGLSMRYIHTYVDAFVDRVFFRKRHEDAAALRNFAHEAAFITDRSILLERSVQEVRDHTNADDATILLFDGSVPYSVPYDENDPAIVAMRAWHKPVDLHAQPNSALQGELAFPMVSRGQLVGVLVCGPKRGGESYAPDESEALRTLAHGVGTALDTLSNHGNGAIESLARTQAIIIAKLEALARISP